MNNLFRSNSPTPSSPNPPQAQKPPKKNKLNFNTMKKNTFNSLNEVEYFLNNFHKISRYLKIYKLFK